MSLCPPLPLLGTLEGGHSPHFWLLQDSYDPLDPVHGHALLEAAQPWRTPKIWESSLGGVRGDRRVGGGAPTSVISPPFQPLQQLRQWPDEAPQLPAL